MVQHLGLFMSGRGPGPRVGNLRTEAEFSSEPCPCHGIAA